MRRLKTITWQNAAADRPGAADGPCERRDNPGPSARRGAAAARRTRSRGVTVVGFDSVASTSAHSEAKLAGIAARAVDRCARAWGWRPTNLTICFHSGGRSFGIARGTGDGPRIGVTVVSLSCRLVSEYDARSVGRTVVHELCHHYREETFRRTAELRRTGGHDSVFCRELALADPQARDPHRCRRFTAERVPREVDPRVSWDPARGSIRLLRVRGKGEMLFWCPRRRGAWDPVEFLLTDGELSELASKFERKAVASMRVDGADMTLRGLLEWCADRPSLFPALASKRSRGARPFGRHGAAK